MKDGFCMFLSSLCRMEKHHADNHHVFSNTGSCEASDAICPGWLSAALVTKSPATCAASFVSEATNMM